MWLCVFCVRLCVAVSVAAAARPPGRAGFTGSQWQEVDTRVVRLGLSLCENDKSLSYFFSVFDPPLSPLFMAALHHLDDGPFLKSQAAGAATFFLYLPPCDAHMHTRVSTKQDDGATSAGALNSRRLF